MLLLFALGCGAGTGGSPASDSPVAPADSSADSPDDSPADSPVDTDTPGSTSNCDAGDSLPCPLADGDVRYTTAVEGADAGHQVSGAGDINADGYADLLVGAPSSSSNGPGAAYLVLGGAAPGSIGLGEADATYLGEAAEDGAGLAVSKAGDVNADGYGDLLVGARHNDEGGDLAGAVYLVLGTASPASQALSGAAAKYTGVSRDDYAGTSVAAAGDVNDDGYDDVLVGSFQWFEEGDGAGAAYLILGGSVPRSGSLALADALYTGAANVGRSVSGAGDVDADGYDDMLIGAPLSWTSPEGEHGAAHLMLGGSLPGSAAVSAADASYLGEADRDSAGCAVAGVGDLNGDGYDDMLIGAVYNDRGGASSGAAFLVLGAAAPGSRDLSLADAQYTGEAEYSLAGFSVAGAGDYDNDGFDDLLVGAPGYSTGYAYLVLGAASPTPSALLAADERYLGEAVDDQAGFSVSGAGDVDADGDSDVLISANTTAEGGTVYLFFGVPR